MEENYDITVQCADKYAGGRTPGAWNEAVPGGMLSGSDAPG